MKWAVVDIETSGLDPVRHDVIEVGIYTDRNVPYAFSLPFSMAAADPEAMEINKFNERKAGGTVPDEYTLEDAARLFQSVFQGRMIVASPAHFDIGFLTCWHFKHGFSIPWGHRDIIDLKSYAMAKFGVKVPLKNSVVGSVLGIEDTSDHSAMADAAWTAAIWKELIS